MLHDFGNSYFPALMVHQGITPESIIFDIYDFNQYVWNLGYSDVLLDFYYNSPFNTTAFYVLAYIEDAYLAKAIFNSINIIVLILSVIKLVQIYQPKQLWGILLIPILFYIPIKNGILYGQSYLLILALVIFGFYQIQKQKSVAGTTALGFVALLKFFPVYYGIPILFHRKWKVIWVGIIVTVIWIGIGIFHSGVSLWDFFFFEVLPDGMRNGTVMDFRINSQSFDVFFKTLFVSDAYYNPDVMFDSPIAYRILIWIVKALILGVTIHSSWKKRNHLFCLLSIWIVALFLLQSKTSSYAQILWLIPAFHIYTSSLSKRFKVAFFATLLVVCNLPITTLIDLPVFFKFSRLWLSVVLAFIFYRSLEIRFDWRYLGLTLMLLLPLNSRIFSGEDIDTATYVLDEKKYFMIYDYEVVNGKLQYGALGRNGDERILTDISITDFDESEVTLIDNQIYLRGKQLTITNELKKKPVLINSCEVYYLGDRMSRRGAFTLKKINICNP